MERPFSFPSIGIDISDESFKYMRFGADKDHRTIAFFGDHDLPRGLVEEGEIKDIAGASKILKEVLRPYRQSTPYLICSLPEEKGFLRLIRMQKLPASEVRSALEFQLEEHIPYAPGDLYFDYHILPQGISPKNDMRVVVMAYPRAIVDAYIQVVEQAGFAPVIFELESQAIARAVVPRGSDEATLVGDIGRTRTTFFVVYRGNVLFTSTVKMGGRDLNATLRDSLHVTEEQALEIKIGRGIDFSSEEIIKSMSPALSVLKAEAERQINFWNKRREDGEPAITAAYLCGGDAHLKGLPEFLSRDLGVTVTRAKIWENLFDLNHYVPPMGAHSTMRYATAFGLAMRGDDDLFSDVHI